MSYVKIISSLILVLLFGSCTSDNPVGGTGDISQDNFAWVVASPEGWGRSITADNNGNTYVTGSYYNSNFIGIGKSGEFLWAENNWKNKYTNVWIDGNQNIYIAGDFKGGTEIIKDLDLPGDANLVKIDETGKLLWGIKLPTTASGVKTDLYGNVFLVSDGIYKIASDGSIIYKIELPFYMISELCPDKNGNLLITGRITGGSIELGNVRLNSVTEEDLFVAKFGPHGECLWAKNYGHEVNKGETWSSFSYGLSIAADNSGNVYLLGGYDIVYTIEGTKLGVENTPGSGGFIISYTGDGVFRWIKNLGVVLNGGGILRIDKQNKLYLSAGYFGKINFPSVPADAGGNNLCVAKLDTEGNAEWCELADCIYPGFVSDLFIDDSGNCYLTGQFQRGIKFGSKTILSDYLGFFAVKINKH